MVDNSNINTSCDVFNMVIPPKGPIAIPVTFDFTQSIEDQEVDFSYLINNGQLDFVSGVYMNDAIMAPGNGAIQLRASGTNQSIYLPWGYVGYYPIMIQNPAKVNVSVAGGTQPDKSFTLIFYNFPQYPFSYNPAPAA